MLVSKAPESAMEGIAYRRHQNANSKISLLAAVRGSCEADSSIEPHGTGDRVLQETGAGDGWFNSASIAVEKLKSQPPLKQLDASRYRGLRQIERLSGATNATLFRRRQSAAEISQVKHEVDRGLSKIHPSQDWCCLPNISGSSATFTASA
nr:hypothetical protein [Mesorhizobium loti]